MASNISGPQIPSHLLSKRKRVEQGGEEGGEVAVQAQAVQASRSSTGRAEETTKKKRVAGPAPPPAALEERPPGSPDGGSESGGSSSTSSTSDDEFGPALPSASRTEVRGISWKLPLEAYTADFTLCCEQQEEEEFEARLRLARYETMRTLGAADANDGKPKRDEWMIVPPKSEDWTAKVDPTKIKNRKFQTGRGAKAPPQRPGGENTLWTETPEQRRQRLEDEVMGRKKPATQGPAPSSDSVGSAEARETARRIEEYNVRAPCLGNDASRALTPSRCNTGANPYMRSTRAKLGSRKTTPAKERLTEKRTLREAARSTTSRRRRC